MHNAIRIVFVCSLFIALLNYDVQCCYMPPTLSLSLSLISRSPEHFYTLDRHYMRRPALIQPTDQEISTLSSVSIPEHIHSFK